MRSRLLAFILLFVSATTGRAATLLPLEIEDAVLLPPGEIEIALTAVGLYEYQPLFRDVKRDQWNAPGIAIHAGLGSRAEAQFRLDALWFEEDPTGTPQRSSTYDVGDARLFTKVRVFSMGDYGMEWLPATALQFGLKLPNADRSKGAGTDEADFFGSFLLSQDVAFLRLHSNLGMAILGNPGPTSGQDDLFLYGFAAESREIRRWSDAVLVALAEVTGSEGSRFDTERPHAAAGLQLSGRPFSFYLGGSIGLDARAEDFGIRVGIIYASRVFSD